MRKTTINGKEKYKGTKGFQRRNVLRLIHPVTLEKAINSIFSDADSIGNDDDEKIENPTSPSINDELKEQQTILNGIQRILYDSQFNSNVITKESIRINNITKKVVSLNEKINTFIFDILQPFNKNNSKNGESQNSYHQPEIDSLNITEEGKTKSLLSQAAHKAKNIADLQSIIKR